MSLAKSYCCCFSWDSMGCESGIVLRESDPETPTPTEILYQQNSLRQILLKQQQSMQNSIGDKNHGLNGFKQSPPQSGSVVSGAFRPVPRRQRSLPNPQGTSAGQVQMVTRSKAGSLGSNPLEEAAPIWTDAERESRERSASTGEKRKWSQVTYLGPRRSLEFKPAIGSMETLDGSRETLTAARRTPVKLLISSGLETIKGEEDPVEFVELTPTTSESQTGQDGLPAADGSVAAVAGSVAGCRDILTTGRLLKVSPRKKCRPDLVSSPAAAATGIEELTEPGSPLGAQEISGTGVTYPCRPCLNFEKMREVSELLTLHCQVHESTVDSRGST